MDDTILLKLSFDNLRDAFQQAGYRVEILNDPVAGMPFLHSATGGVGFDIRPGNRLLGDEEHFVDATFVAILIVHGQLPLEIVNQWNAMRRFGRLQLSQNVLAFTMDISVVGGVMPAHLRSQIAIWDQLVQELIAYFRDEIRKIGGVRGATAPAASVNPKSAEPAYEPTAEAPMAIQ